MKVNSRSTPDPPTPISMIDNSVDNLDNVFDVSNLEIRIKWDDDNWVAQLSYNDNVLLEGRQLNVEQEIGFVQSFFWFCEEASFLAYEFKAREHAFDVRKGTAIDTEPLMQDEVNEDHRWQMPARSKGKEKRRSLKLRIRFRNTARGAAGVWRVD